MTNITSQKYLDIFLAYLSLNDDISSELLTAIYQPTLARTIERHYNLNNLTASELSVEAIRAFQRQPHKPHFGNRQAVESYLLSHTIRILARKEGDTSNSYCSLMDNFIAISETFKKILDKRMKNALSCSEKPNESSFNVQAFKNGEKEPDQILYEAFWVDIVFFCEEKISSTLPAVAIAKAVFEDILARRQEFDSLLSIKEALYLTAKRFYPVLLNILRKQVPHENNGLTG